MSVYDFSNILSAFADAGMAFLLFEAFLQRRARLPVGAYIGGMITLSLATCVWNYFFMFQTLNLVGMTLLLLIASALYRGQWWKKISIVFAILLINLILEVVVTDLLSLVLHETVEDIVHIPHYRLFGVLASKLSGLAVCNAFRVKTHHAQYDIKPAYWLIFLFLYLSFSSVTFLLFRLSYALHTTYYNLEIVLCVVVLLLSITFLLFLYEKQGQQNLAIREKEQYEQQLKFQLKHLDDLLANQEAMRKFRHDLAHQMTGLRATLEAGDTTAALRHLDALSDHLQSTATTIDTGNLALDAILSAKKELAEKSGIATTFKLRVQEDLPLASEDVCTIFGNALDNAIEACERLERGAPKQISLSLIQIDNQLLGKIVNTALERQSKEFRTSKHDHQNHGYGLANLRDALSHYDCTPDITWENGEFILKFFLPLDKSQQENEATASEK